MAEALYRKYRPQIFEDVVGQEQIEMCIRDSAHAEHMCEECMRRAEINPLRAFDCKNPGCAEVMEGAPKISDYLCDDCREHYQAVKTYLDGAGISYICLLYTSRSH